MQNSDSDGLLATALGLPTDPRHEHGPGEDGFAVVLFVVEAHMTEGLLRSHDEDRRLAYEFQTSAKEIIHPLEQTPRGIDCGVIGWLGYNGGSSPNIAIRTLVGNGDRLVYQVGTGIVADSPREKGLRGHSP